MEYAVEEALDELYCAAPEKFTQLRTRLAACLVVVAVLLWTLTLSGHAEEVAPGQEKKPLFAVTVTGSGRPMILIPGLSCGGNVWDGTVTHFKDRYECHVVTLAGFAGQPANSIYCASKWALEG